MDDVHGRQRLFTLRKVEMKQTLTLFHLMANCFVDIFAEDVLHFFRNQVTDYTEFFKGA